MSRDLLKLIKIGLKSLAFPTILIVSLWLLPNKTWLTINLTVVTLVLLKSLYEEPPQVKKWLVKTFWTILFCTSFLALFWLAGAWGLLALIILYLGIAAFALYKGRRLYDNYTTAVAEWIKGKPFDLSKVVNYGQETSTSIDGLKTGTERTGSTERAGEEPARIIPQSEDSSKVVPKVQGARVQRQHRRKTHEQGQVVSDVREDI